LRAAQSAGYLSYSETDFEVLRPQRRHVAPIAVTFGTEEGTFGPVIRAKFHPNRYNDKSIEPPKVKYLLRFDQNVEYKRTRGADPLHDFHKICRLCIRFRLR